MQDLRIQDTQTLHPKMNRRSSAAHVALRSPDFKGLRPHIPLSYRKHRRFLHEECFNNSLPPLLNLRQQGLCPAAVVGYNSACDSLPNSKEWFGKRIRAIACFPILRHTLLSLRQQGVVYPAAASGSRHSRSAAASGSRHCRSQPGRVTARPSFWEIRQAVSIS